MLLSLPTFIWTFPFLSLCCLSPVQSSFLTVRYSPCGASGFHEFISVRLPQPLSSSQGPLILISVRVLKFTHHTFQWSPLSCVGVFIFSGSSHTCWFLLLPPIHMPIIYRSCTVSLLSLSELMLDTLSPSFVKNVVHRFLVFFSCFSIFMQGFKKARDCVATTTVVFPELTFLFLFY